MALDDIVADPLTFRVGYGSTVRITVKKLGQVFSAANFPADGLAEAKYTVEVRALERGATEYAVREEIDKTSEDGIAEGPLPVWGADAEDKTFKFWVVLIDSSTAPTGAATLSGDFEEVLGEFTRTVQPGLVGA